jgi:hypothetical protein
VGSAHGSPRPHRPSPRARPRRSAGGELRPEVDAAGEQRHPDTPGAAGIGADRSADHRRIDDWAWRRNQRYGTIICDLERRRTIALLPDREHLKENASSAFLDAVRKSMRQVRAAIGATTVDPKLLTAAESIQYEGYLRRQEANAAIHGLATQSPQSVLEKGEARRL